MIFNYVFDDATGLNFWTDDEDKLPGKGLQKIKEFSIYKLFSQKENDILKKTSQEIVLTIMIDEKIELINKTKIFHKGFLMLLFDNMYIKNQINQNIISYAKSIK